MLGIHATHVLFFFLGFVTDFTSIAEFYLLRDGLGLSISACYAAATFINLPWAFRPIWGYISDRAGRKSLQLGVLSGVATIGWFMMLGVSTLGFTLVILFMCEIVAAAGLTIADAYVVCLTRDNPSAMPQHHRFRILGKVAASVLAGQYLSYHNASLYSIHTIFGIQAFVYTFVALIITGKLRDPEPVSDPTATARPGFRQYVVDTFALVNKSPHVKFILVCFTLFLALPDSGTAISYFLIGPLGISPFTLSIVEGARGVFDYLGTHVDIRAAPEDVMISFLTIANLLCIPVMAVVCRSTVDILPDEILLVLTSMISAAMGSMFSTILSVHVARIAPEGSEGGSYNGIISIPNIGQAVGVVITYALTRMFEIDHDDFSNLVPFVFLTSVLGCFLSAGVQFAKTRM